MEPIIRYKFPYSLETKDLLLQLEDFYSIEEEPVISENKIYFDTFDWRLFNAGLVLINFNHTFQLLDFKSELPFEVLNWKRKNPPKFWWDFAESELKQRLKSILDVRALIHLFESEKGTQFVKILNEDEKIILKLEIQLIKLLQKTDSLEIPILLKIQPVRGYRKEVKSFNSFLKKLNFKFTSKSEFEIIANSAGLKVGDYSSKLNIKLRRNQSSLEATRIILINLVQTIKKNEEGIKADIDTEFLHDFRVAVRRTRSALTQIKGVLPKEEKNQFKQKFAQLGQVTNKMRDLDVYLLKKAEYQSLLPENVRPGLNFLFNSLKRQRRVELKKVTTYLNSDSYKTTISDWETFLEKLDNTQNHTKNAKKPIYDLARKFIFNQYKIVIKSGEKITAATPNEQLHRLRIECKKLRYLLEFFSSLFSATEISGLVKQFKKLQDNLGDFNDLSVQQNQLQDFLINVKVKEENKILVSTSVGGLISVLFQKHKSVRNEFEKTFKSFHTKETDQLFSRLFN